MAENTTVGHTPGPWRVGADLIRVHTYWRDENGNCTSANFHRNGFAKAIAIVGREDGDWRHISQQVSDAHLIAAAPELYEALKDARQVIAILSELLTEEIVDARVGNPMFLIDAALLKASPRAGEGV